MRRAAAGHRGRVLRRPPHPRAATRGALRRGWRRGERPRAPPRRMRSDGLETVNVPPRGTTVPDAGGRETRPSGEGGRLYRRCLLSAQVGEAAEQCVEERLPAPCGRSASRSPVVDHASQRERRFDGARDLVQHELEVTPACCNARAWWSAPQRGWRRGPNWASLRLVPATILPARAEGRSCGAADRLYLVPLAGGVPADFLVRQADRLGGLAEHADPARNLARRAAVVTRGRDRRRPRARCPRTPDRRHRGQQVERPPGCRVQRQRY